MLRTFAWFILICLCLIPLTMGITCSTFPTDEPETLPTDEPETENDMTAAEQAAAKAAVQSVGGLSQSAAISQSTTNDERSSSALQPRDLSAGTCPEVSTASILGEAGRTVTVDFGEGCEVNTVPGYSCSGSASGQINATDRLITLQFDNISCTGNTALDGNLAVTYVVLVSSVSLNGDWDLTWTAEDQDVATTGTGECSYDSQNDVTTFTTFAGTLSQDNQTWAVEIDTLLISYPTYQSYVPYSGTMTISGNSIRAITIRFNEDSPSTGQVEISIAGSPFFTVGLDEL